MTDAQILSWIAVGISLLSVAVNVWYEIRLNRIKKRYKKFDND